MERSRCLSKLVADCGDENQYFCNLVFVCKYVDKEINVCTEIEMIELAEDSIMSSSKMLIFHQSKIPCFSYF